MPIELLPALFSFNLYSRIGLLFLSVVAVCPFRVWPLALGGQ